MYVNLNLIENCIYAGLIKFPYYSDADINIYNSRYAILPFAYTLQLALFSQLSLSRSLSLSVALFCSLHNPYTQHWPLSHSLTWSQFLTLFTIIEKLFAALWELLSTPLRTATSSTFYQHSKIKINIALIYICMYIHLCVCLCRWEISRNIMSILVAIALLVLQSVHNL